MGYFSFLNFHFPLPTVDKQGLVSIRWCCVISVNPISLCYMSLKKCIIFGHIHNLDWLLPKPGCNLNGIDFHDGRTTSLECNSWYFKSSPSPPQHNHIRLKFIFLSPKMVIIILTIIIISSVMVGHDHGQCLINLHLQNPLMVKTIP